MTTLVSVSAIAARCAGCVCIDLHRRPRDCVTGLAIGLCARRLEGRNRLDASWRSPGLPPCQSGQVSSSFGESQMESSISNLLVLFGAVLFGPLAAMVIGAASMLGAVRHPRLSGSHTRSRAPQRRSDRDQSRRQAASLATSDVGSIAVSAICGGAAVEFVDLGFVSLPSPARQPRSRTSRESPAAGHTFICPAVHAAGGAPRDRLRKGFTAHSSAISCPRPCAPQALRALPGPAQARR